MDIFQIGRAAIREVFFQHRFDLFREAVVEREDRDFEIQADRSRIEIGRADGGEIVVGQEYFLVQKTIRVTVDFDAAADGLGDKIETGEVFAYDTSNGQFVPLAQYQYQPSETAVRRRTSGTI